MNNPVETIKVSEQAKDQLVRLKRKTGIGNWNVLCRWAIAVSLAETNPPPPKRIKLDSNIEIPWRTFGGDYADVYAALMYQRCLDDGLGVAPDVLSEQFKLHLHRGIGYLANDSSIDSIDALFDKLPVEWGANA